MPARYLLRFDDICPTMNLSVWDELERVLIEEGVKPIVAVVPENRDPELVAAPAMPDFWDRVRRWQSLGWTIGLHGYQHLFSSTSSGVMALNNISEFAGLSRPEQAEKLRRALEIFSREGVAVHTWVAPAHSFDATTLELLPEYGISSVSDGFTLYPFEDRRGIQWVPQQLWRFRWFPVGIFTVCLHHNNLAAEEVAALCDDLRRFKTQLVSFGEVTARYRGRRKRLLDRVFWWGWTRMIRVRRGARLLCGGAPAVMSAERVG